MRTSTRRPEYSEPASTVKQAKRPRSYSVQSLVRAFDILDVVAQSGGELGLQEISLRAQLHISTVFRLMQTLEHRHLVERNRETGRYRIGWKVLSWSTQVLHATDVRGKAEPFLQELNQKTHETVHLTVRDEDAAVYIHKFESPIPLRIYSQIGKRAPLYCTGVGKILLAAMGDKERKDWLRRNSLKRFTPNTITDRTKLEREIARIKRLGYAMDNEEHELHVRCVAAPIHNYRGDVVAAASITVPSVRMTASRLPNLIQDVKDTANRISVQLGYGDQVAGVRGKIRKSQEKRSE